MKVSPFPDDHDPRRQMPRHNTDAVSCPLGELLDLSGTGMRVAVKGRCLLKVGQQLPLRLKTSQGSIPVTARIVWKKKTGLLGNYQLGCHFEGLKPNLSLALATIARFGFVAADEVKSVGGGSASSGSAQQPGEADRHGRGASIGGPSSIEASLVLAPYFETLGLDPGADREQIKSAYRQLARRYHPDVAPGEDNRQKFLKLREAYDLLIRRAGRAG